MTAQLSSDHTSRAEAVAPLGDPSRCPHRETGRPGRLLQAQGFLLVGVGIQQRVELLRQRRVGLRLDLPTFPDLLRTNKLDFIPVSAVHSSLGFPHPLPWFFIIFIFIFWFIFFFKSWCECRGRGLVWWGFFGGRKMRFESLLSRREHCVGDGGNGN